MIDLLNSFSFWRTILEHCTCSFHVKSSKKIIILFSDFCLSNNVRMNEIASSKVEQKKTRLSKNEENQIRNEYITKQSKTKQRTISIKKNCWIIKKWRRVFHFRFIKKHSNLFNMRLNTNKNPINKTENLFNLNKPLWLYFKFIGE